MQRIRSRVVWLAHREGRSGGVRSWERSPHPSLAPWGRHLSQEIRSGTRVGPRLDLAQTIADTVHDPLLFLTPTSVERANGASFTSFRWVLRTIGRP
jgi:hypothetical protein